MSSNSSGSPGSPKTVLFVDDQKDLREMAQMLLAKGGFFKVVGEAQDGGSALAQMESLKPNVVLLDIELPDVYGVEVCVRIRRDFPGTAVVIMSAHNERVYRDEALKAGAIDFIPKFELTARRLQQALQQRQEG